jgi:uncharacterized protein YqeY
VFFQRRNIRGEAVVALTAEIQKRLTDAMKAKDQRVVDTLRMVRARLMEVQNAKGFEGEMTDERVVETIAAYVKQLRKALPDYERAGDAGRAMAEKLTFEIDYLTQFLPKALDEAATRALVTDVLAKLGVTDPKRAGQVVGAVMKTHAGQVEPALVKRLVDEALTGHASSGGH